MAIPESQLESWTGLGAQQGSANTYNSIQAALQAHTWPGTMNQISYLQGSYPNFTNIRGDSDVDVVVESTNVFYNDALPELRAQLGLTGGGSYGWRELRSQVKSALENYYGAGLVSESTSGKCLRVARRGNRLDADVVPCVTIKHYDGTFHAASGITLWTKAGVQIVNYPKLHLQNGASKNTACNQQYKPTVRIFKNARNRAGSNFPSYFLECMIYNVPTVYFSTIRADTFREALVFLYNSMSNGTLDSFSCQNGQQSMFGNQLHQVDVSSAQVLINQLVNLWDNWS